MELISLVSFAGVFRELHADQFMDRRGIAFLRIAVGDYDVELNVEQRASRGEFQCLDFGLGESDFSVIADVAALNGQSFRR